MMMADEDVPPSPLPFSLSLLALPGDDVLLFLLGQDDTDDKDNPLSDESPSCGSCSVVVGVDVVVVSSRDVIG